MSAQSIYLEDLKNALLYLSAPLPIELEGEAKNWVATWAETQLEAEGTSKSEAIRNMQKEIVTAYDKLEAKAREGAKMKEDEERLWRALSHYVAERGGKKKNDKEDMGPFFG